MKRNFCIWAILYMTAMSACSEESKSPMVWGSINALGTRDADGTRGPITLNGLTLGEPGGYLIGYCKYENDKFSFSLGTESPGSIDVSTDYYFSIEGIKGPPSDTPYDAAGNPRDDEARTFSNGEIYTSAGAWLFDTSDFIEDQCLVVVFAEGTSGNLTPLEYGKEQFDYLVNIDCDGGLDSIPSRLAPDDTASELNGFQMTLWFKNCEG